MKVVRAFDASVGEGRTLEGYVWKTGAVQRVSDDGITTYQEAYSEAASLGNDPAPVMLAHPWDPHQKLEPRTHDIFGSVEFIPASDGLQFRAVLADDEFGNAALTMLRVGGLSRKVSWGGEAVDSRKERDVIWRDKVLIEELSLLPNGTRGALTGAQIDVMRSAIDTIPSRLIRHRLRVALLS